MQTPPYDTARFARLASKAVIFGIVTTIVFDLLGIWENQQLRIIMSQDTPYSEAISRSGRLDTIMFFSGIAIIVVSIFSLVMTLIWTFRASKNAAFMDLYPNRIRPGWAVGWYFIPFANLWKPFEAIKEIWNSSFSPALAPNAPATAAVGFWWAAHVSNNIFEMGLLRKQRRTDDIEVYMAINNALLISTALTVLTGILFIIIMRQVSARQMAWSGPQIDLWWKGRHSSRTLTCEAPMPIHYLYLLIAIIAEVIGTSALQASAQFTRFWPSVIVVSGYTASFIFMAYTLKYMPVSIVYAIWSGLGIVFIALIGYFWFKQSLDAPAIIGLSLIIAGVLVIHLFSNTATH